MKIIMSSNRKREKDNTTFWDERRGSIRTSKGGWIPGKIVHNHGYSMMDDLVGRVSYFQVMMLNVTGRMPERRLAEWMEAYFICNSYPDARIWCNQIGSLAGTIRSSPVAAVTAGILASDSRMYGPGTLSASIAFITDALAKKKQGLSAEEIVCSHQRRSGSKPLIIGYVRPVASGDERIPALERVAENLGFVRGEHLTMAYAIEEVMVEKANERMNLLGYIVPFLCDQDFSPQEIYRILSTMVSAGVLACYAEAADQPPTSFFPLHCEDIDYQGKPFRRLPERKGHDLMRGESHEHR